MTGKKCAFVFFSVLPFLLMVSSAYYLQLRWDEIPDAVPVHYDIRFSADSWVEKDSLQVYAALFTGLFAVTALLIPLTVGLLLPLKRAERLHRRMSEIVRFRASLFVLGAANFLAMLCCYFAVGGALYAENVQQLGWISPAAILVSVGLLCGLANFLLKPQAGTGFLPDDVPDMKQSFWKMGLFYFNPDNPAVLVEYRYGYGVTLNFGRGLSWVILAALLAPAALTIGVVLLLT
ncbi:MAG: hypothetical protein WC655_19815 [Candidatus Hydrogenedentales bacterium]|jgi:uncharacterized membrane protein